MRIAAEVKIFPWTQLNLDHRATCFTQSHPISLWINFLELLRTSCVCSLGIVRVPLYLAGDPEIRIASHGPTNPKRTLHWASWLCPLSHQVRGSARKLNCFAENRKTSLLPRIEVRWSFPCLDVDSSRQQFFSFPLSNSIGFRQKPFFLKDKVCIIGSVNPFKVKGRKNVKRLHDEPLRRV